MAATNTVELRLTFKDSATAGIERARAIFMKNMERMRTHVFALEKAVFNLKTAVAGLGVTYGIKKFSDALIDAGSKTENYRIRLKYLLGSQEEGARLFQELSEYASKVPFTYENIMAAGTQLAGVIKGGVGKIREWIALIGDLAAVSGLSITQATEQVVRMYSAGAAAADLFRERGVLAMLGFKAGVSYTAEETRKRLMEAWKKVGSKFRGATEDLANTWEGLMSMLKDAWFQLRTKIADAGVFAYLKGGVKMLVDKINELKKAGKDTSWAVAMSDRIISALEKVIFTAGLLASTFRGFRLIWVQLKEVFYAVVAIPLWKGLHKVRTALTSLIESFVSLAKKLPSWIPGVSAIRSALEGWLETSRRIGDEQREVLKGLQEELGNTRKELFKLSENLPWKYAGELIVKLREKLASLRSEAQKTSKEVTKVVTTTSKPELPEGFVNKLSALQRRPITLPTVGMESPLESTYKEYEEGLARLQEYYNQRSIIIATSLQNEAQMEAQYSALKRQYIQTEQALRMQMYASTLGATAGFFNNLYTIAGSSHKKLFTMMKAFNIAQALMDAYTAFNRTLASLPYPWNVAAAAAVLAQGLARVQQIRAMRPGGSAGGGGIGGGTIRVGDKSAGGSGSPATARPAPTITVNINNPLTGSDEEWERLVEERIAPAIKRAVERNIEIM